MENILNHSGTKEAGISERERLHGRLARRLAAEGIVLLKNEGVLPFRADAKLALLGGGAARTIKGGTGSGDVNNRENVSIRQGFKNAGIDVVSEEWLNDYDARYVKARENWKEKVLEAAKHVENPFDAYAANPFVMPEGRELTEADINGAEAVVYVVSRISGEGRDRRAENGDYYLSRKEREDILQINRSGLPIVLLLNSGGPIELTDLLEEAEQIKAVLYISQLGQEGGNAVADVLLGHTVPGGRLTATWAKRYADYPGAEAYSYLNGDLGKEEYREGSFVGYRYLDSFGIEPLYPFGYGLSYTSFEMACSGIRVGEGMAEIDVTVKNIGDTYAGRETVQVYATLPQAGETKEYQRLVGFAKTKELRPQEAETVTVVIAQKQLAVFSEQRRGWVIEAGVYGLWIGRHSADVRLTALLDVRKESLIEQTYPICPLTADWQDPVIPDAAKEKEALWRLRAETEGVRSILFTPIEEKKPEAKKPFLPDQPVEELIPLLYGNITEGTATLGSSGVRVPGSAGETSEALEKTYGIPSMVMADGPAGLRLRQSYEVDLESDTVYGVGVLGSLENGYLEPAGHHENSETYYQYCTAFPVGTALAQTWDVELVKAFGAAVAEEMEELHVSLWLAPGMNIQRNPLCGRNFEYYSEDPLLSGKMAAAVTAGVQTKESCGVTIKHFACNNQEDNRMGVDSRVSEKALREIYLRGFEIAVKESAPAAVMTSYNLVNGIHAANSRDLCTVLLREEWGFNGIVMSDWNTTCPADGSVSWMCAAAGNDVIMPGNAEDDADIRSAYRDGRLSEEVIRISAGRVISLAKKCFNQFD